MIFIYENAGLQSCAKISLKLILLFPFIWKVVEKELLIKEKEKLYIELKQILARQPGPEVAEQLSIYQQNLKEKTRQMKVGSQSKFFFYATHFCCFLYQTSFRFITTLFLSQSHHNVFPAFIIKNSICMKLTFIAVFENRKTWHFFRNTLVCIFMFWKDLYLYRNHEYNIFIKSNTTLIVFFRGYVLKDIFLYNQVLCFDFLICNIYIYIFFLQTMASELNMYESQVQDYKYDIERLSRELQDVKKKYFLQKKREQQQRFDNSFFFFCISDGIRFF